ncbi:MAG: hypothetical protein NC311_05485 [Muribaculaceae bacterium]|nr:hypothetical protein [Muribaculaceae bacterium]
MNKISLITAVAITAISSNCVADNYLTSAQCLMILNTICPELPAKTQVRYDSATCSSTSNACTNCTGTITVPTGYKAANNATSVSVQATESCARKDASSLQNIYVKTCSCEPKSTTVTCDTANGYTGTPRISNGAFYGCAKQSSTTKCAKGEYLASDHCETCPSLHGVAATTKRIRLQYLITDCYIPKDSVITDETGTYTLTDDCQYSAFSIIDPDTPIIKP